MTYELRMIQYNDSLVVSIQYQIKKKQTDRQTDVNITSQESLITDYVAVIMYLILLLTYWLSYKHLISNDIPDKTNK